MSIATAIMAVPTIWGTFVVVRSGIRKIGRSWQAFKTGIRLEAVAEADGKRLIEEGLQKAAIEAADRAKKHLEANAKQEQYYEITKDLQVQFATQAENIAQKVEDKVAAAVRVANAEQTEALVGLQGRVIDHEARFEKIDATLERIETGVKNGHGQ